MRSVICRVCALLVITLCSGMGHALAESPPAVEDSWSLAAVNTWNTAVEQGAVDASASSYASATKARAEGLRDSESVKPKDPPQESAPTPGQPKLSFWQWLSGGTVDCSSGVCLFK